MAQIKLPQYIIAIGASAGGLEAISSFFDHTPLDSVSYIVIQHLSSDFKSQMAQILDRHSKLEIVEVTNNLLVESNKVYLIPSTHFMEIRNGKLFLIDKETKPKPHLTVDHFFSSLAADLKGRAIGVILSGTGNDGSKGIMAINQVNGFLLIQEPNSAIHSGMPEAAIATGCKALVVVPEKMPGLIENYVKNNPIVAPEPELKEEISEAELRKIMELIKGNLPLDFSDYKRPTISRRIVKRMAEHHIKTAIAYHKYLIENPHEIELLANDFLIVVTSFFRDPEAFAIIENEVIPKIIDNKDSGDVIKVWVAGCATGEEAYSIAILIREYLDKVKSKVEVKIFATDLNAAALKIASKGKYNKRIANAMTANRLNNFFNSQNGGYQVVPDIRKMLIFAQHDLVKNPPYCNIDLISCRNLLIYMNPVLQQKVFAMMHFGLVKNGYLFLGSSESVTKLLKDFVEVSFKWNILQSKKSGKYIRFDNFSSPNFDGFNLEARNVTKKPNTNISKSLLDDEIQQAILEEANYNGICTDRNLKVIQSFGDITPYLKNEIFNFNLNDLLPDDIAVNFKAAAHQALKLKQRIIMPSLVFKIGTKKRSADVVIKPFLKTNTSENCLLILFISVNENLVKASTAVSPDFGLMTKEHLLDLENELTETKTNLGIAYERITSSEENMQSFNEELLSANEEMQSANEELQSLNEELQTINKEQQQTNIDLTEANDDLNNYFRSDVNGQLFVDSKLCIKKYSPAATQHINVIPTDIGRPLENITTNIPLPTLIDDIQRVIDKTETVTIESKSKSGKIYQVMIMPYIREIGRKVDGAIVSFFEVTEFKRLLDEVDHSNKKLTEVNLAINKINSELLLRNEELSDSRMYTEEIFHTIHDPLLILNQNLKVLRASEGFFQMFKVNKKETEGTNLYDLGNRQWDIPVLRHQLEEVLPQKGSFKAFEVEHVLTTIGKRIMQLTARQFNSNTDHKLILLAIHDLTDSRKVEEGLAEAERLLDESKERLHFAIESAGIGAWDYNLLTKELVWDNRCRAIYGLKPKDYLDYSVFLNLIYTEDRARINEAINEALAGKNNGEYNVEYRTSRLAKQKFRWIKSKGKAYFDTDGEATRFIGTVLDISVEKSVEENTKELLLKKDEFIGIASHELKTPLTTLKASLQLLHRIKLNPSAEKFEQLYSHCNKSMDKITHLIDDLLNTTRMSEGQLSLNKKAFSLFEMLKQCSHDVRLIGKHKLIISGDPTIMLLADQDRLEQVVVNFVNNAVKYAPDVKNIYLKVEQIDSLAKVSVTDGGPGIEQDKLPMLFDRYFRTDYSGKQYSGLGLGLYICSEIIKHHGGNIGVDSKLGKGSSFWFTLPME